MGFETSPHTAIIEFYSSANAFASDQFVHLSDIQCSYGTNSHITTFKRLTDRRKDLLLDCACAHSLVDLAIFH